MDRCAGMHCGLDLLAYQSVTSRCLALNPRYASQNGNKKQHVETAPGRTVEMLLSTCRKSRSWETIHGEQVRNLVNGVRSLSPANPHKSRPLQKV